LSNGGLNNHGLQVPRWRSFGLIDTLVITLGRIIAVQWAQGGQESGLKYHYDIANHYKLWHPKYAVHHTIDAV
jgi:hypothetical protein